MENSVEKELSYQQTTLEQLDITSAKQNKNKCYSYLVPVQKLT